MKWKIISDYHAISEDGRYTVCIVYLPVDGKLTRTYEAWRNPRFNGDLGEQLQCRIGTAKEAQRVCEDHAHAHLDEGTAA